ncbi:MAG: hypothetical protein V1909_01265 [Candidatus Micrarchaeota archaeon]
MGEKLTALIIGEANPTKKDGPLPFAVNIVMRQIAELMGRQNEVFHAAGCEAGLREIQKGGSAKPVDVVFVSVPFEELTSMPNLSRLLAPAARAANAAAPGRITVSAIPDETIDGSYGNENCKTISFIRELRRTHPKVQVVALIDKYMTSESFRTRRFPEMGALALYKDEVLRKDGGEADARIISDIKTHLELNAQTQEIRGGNSAGSIRDMRNYRLERNETDRMQQTRPRFIAQKDLA